MRRGGRPQRDDAAFKRRIEDARARTNLSDVVNRHTALRRAGRELSGLCPFHSERGPSFQVNDSTGLYHCFGCGRSGDAIRFLMEKDGLTFMEALRDLEGGTYPEVDPAERTRRAEEDAAARAAAIAEARRIWEGALESQGTPAEVYARSRGVIVPLPPSIRFAETYAWVDKETGEVGPDIPALIGAVTDGAGELVAIQRIFLRDGGRAKAKMKKPKLSLGRVKGGALRLDGNIGNAVPEIGAVRTSLESGTNSSTWAEVIITEGPEDGLSLAQELPGKRIWVALGTAMMPEIEYPPEVRSIVIAGQNDAAGRAAVDKAALALTERGFSVRTMFPDAAFKDWNDQLRGIAK